jgi:hypothetical protein
MENDKTGFIIVAMVGIVAVVAVIAIIMGGNGKTGSKESFDTADFGSEEIVGEAFLSRTSTANTARGTNTASTTAVTTNSGATQNSKYRLRDDANILATKECIRGKIDQGKACGMQCMDSIEKTTAATGTGGAGSRNNDAFRTCIDACKSSFNTEVRTCEQYLPASLQPIAQDCTNKVTLQEYTECLKSGIQTNILEPVRSCLDNCKSTYGASKDIEGGKVCADTCVAQYAGTGATN